MMLLKEMHGNSKYLRQKVGEINFLWHFSAENQAWLIYKVNFWFCRSSSLFSFYFSSRTIENQHNINICKNMCGKKKPNVNIANVC